MGWMDVEENKMSPKIIGETVNACITDLAEKRKDLWYTAETWAGVTFFNQSDSYENKIWEARVKKILLNFCHRPCLPSETSLKLTHSRPLFNFITPENVITRGFLMFSGGIEIKQSEIGQQRRPRSIRDKKLKYP